MGGRHFTTAQEKIEKQDISFRGSRSIPFPLNKIKLYTRHCEELLPFHKAAPLPWTTRLLNLPTQAIGGHVEIDEAVLLWDPRGWAASYYHWIIDFLPAALSVSSSRVKLLVPYNITQWQVDSLRLLGIVDQQCIPVGEKLKPVTVNVRNIIRQGARYSNSQSDDYQKLNADIFRNLIEKLTLKVGTPRREQSVVLVSREDAKTRRLVNEEIIISHLSKFRLKKIVPSRMNLAEQITTFRGATHVVAVHGAALTNLMFCQPETYVLEILSTMHGVRPDIAIISAACNLNYFATLADSVNSSGDLGLDIQSLDSFCKISCLI